MSIKKSDRTAFLEIKRLEMEMQQKKLENEMEMQKKKLEIKQQMLVTQEQKQRQKTNSSICHADHLSGFHLERVLQI